jgi:hypothetical protein
MAANGVVVLRACTAKMETPLTSGVTKERTWFATDNGVPRPRAETDKTVRIKEE